jgi:ATP/maltotriose-dependent transcriptional regulator MalT
MAGSERILLDLADANAFVVSLDPQRTWFRYHQTRQRSSRNRGSRGRPLLPELRCPIGHRHAHPAASLTPCRCR